MADKFFKSLAELQIKTIVIFLLILYYFVFERLTQKMSLWMVLYYDFVTLYVFRGFGVE